MENTLSIFSGIILACVAVPYSVGILKGTLSPRPLSWLGWFLIMSASLIAQILESGFDFLMSIVIGSCMSCLIVFFLSLSRKNRTILFFDYIYLALGILCLVVFLVSKDAFITTVFSVLADLFVSIPTLHNVFINPKSESIIAWGVGSVATGLAFFSSFSNPSLLLKIFPTYLFCINMVTFVLCLRRFLKTSKRKVV